MKNVLYIADLEGVTGVFDLNNFDECKKYMCREVSSVFDALLSNGYTIYFCDCHNDGLTTYELRNKYKEVNFITFVWNINFSITYDCAILTGFHSMAYGGGLFPHTFRREIWRMELGKIKEIGEIGIFIEWLHSYNIPVILLSGEDECMQEADEYNIVLNVSKHKEDKSLFINYHSYYQSLKENLLKALKMQRCCFWHKQEIVKVTLRYHFLNEVFIKYGFFADNDCLWFNDIRNFMSRLEEICNLINQHAHIIQWLHQAKKDWFDKTQNLIPENIILKFENKNIFKLSVEEIEFLYSFYTK